MSINTEAALRIIKVHGPSRVLVSKHGEAVRSSEPEAAKLFVPVIFIRDDGWSLGAPAKLAREAFKLWQNHWAAWLDMREAFAEPKPIAAFNPEEWP